MQPSLHSGGGDLRVSSTAGLGTGPACGDRPYGPAGPRFTKDFHDRTTCTICTTHSPTQQNDRKKEIMANKNTKKKAAIASVALLALGFGGVAVSGAYFTDEVVVPNNTLTAGTVQLEVGTQAGTAVAFENVLPIAAADVETDAELATFNIVNTGTADIDWAVSLGLPADATADELALAGIVQYQLSTDGVTWSTPAAFGTSTAAGFTAATTELAAAGTATAQVRLWLPETATNEYQADSLDFVLTGRAIQAGTPATQFADNSAFAVLYTP